MIFKMIKGKHWPIPDNKILDGSTISLKNSYRLTKDAEILLKEKKYSTVLTIVTLALEEFGKHCMLNEEKISETKTPISKEIWKNQYESHKTKILAISNYFRRFSDPKNLKNKAKLKEMEDYFTDLCKTKLKSLYVDWDGISNNWFYFDDDSPEKEDEAKKAVDTAIWIIEKYLEDIGGDKDLILTKATQRIKLMKEGKVHCFCDRCSTAMLTPEEYQKHNQLCKKAPNWYWNN